MECEANWVNGTTCIDTGCVFGGKLTALRYPELDLVEVPAQRTYYEPIRPLASPATDTGMAPNQLNLSDVLGKQVIETRHYHHVTVREENCSSPPSNAAAGSICGSSTARIMIALRNSNG